MNISPRRSDRSCWLGTPAPTRSRGWRRGASARPAPRRRARARSPSGVGPWARPGAPTDAPGRRRCPTGGRRRGTGRAAHVDRGRPARPGTHRARRTREDLDSPLPPSSTAALHRGASARTARPRGARIERRCARAGCAATSRARRTSRVDDRHEPLRAARGVRAAGTTCSPGRRATSRDRPPRGWRRCRPPRPDRRRRRARPRR